jgi:hypothetical protein
MVQKYTKKPVTIEAIQWTEENLDAALTWIPSEVIGIRILGMEDSNDSLQWTTEHYIKTLEGDMKITEGDFIIKGVKGEFYPCKPDIFYATYDGPTRVLWNHTTGEYDKEWLLSKAFKKESGEHIPNGYDTYIKEKEVEKISEDEARIREILKDPSSVFVGYSQEGYNLHIWINQGKKYYIEPELNIINKIEY